MKKNKMLRFACVLAIVTILSTCVISGTFAKYTTTVSSSDTARVATWGWQDSTLDLDGLFKSSYGLTNVEDVIAVDGESVIAPGTTNSTSFTFKFSGSQSAPEVAYNFKISIDESQIATDIKENKNIQWKLSGGDIANAVWGDWDSLVTAVSALAGSGNYAPGELPTAFNNNQEYTISWQWIFDSYSYALKSGKQLTADDFTVATDYDDYAVISDEVYASLKDCAEIGTDKVEAVSTYTILEDLVVGDFLISNDYNSVVATDDDAFDKDVVLTDDDYAKLTTAAKNAKISAYKVSTGKTLGSSDFASGYTADVVAGTLISADTYATLAKPYGKDKVNTTGASKVLRTGFALDSNDFTSAAAYTAYAVVSDDTYAKLNANGQNKVDVTNSGETYYKTSKAITASDFADAAYINTYEANTVISSAVYGALKTCIVGKGKVTYSYSDYKITTALVPSDFADYTGTASATYDAIKNGVLANGKFITAATYALLNDDGKAKIDLLLLKLIDKTGNPLAASDFADYTTSSAALTDIGANNVVNGYITAAQKGMIVDGSQTKVGSDAYCLVTGTITSDDYADELQTGSNYNAGDYIAFNGDYSKLSFDAQTNKVGNETYYKVNETLELEDFSDYHVSANFNAYTPDADGSITTAVYNQLNATGKGKVTASLYQITDTLTAADFADVVYTSANYDNAVSSDADALNSGKTITATIKGQLFTSVQNDTTVFDTDSYVLKRTLTANDFADIDLDSATSDDYTDTVTAPFQVDEVISSATYNALKDSKKTKATENVKYYRIDTALTASDFADYDEVEQMSANYNSVLLNEGSDVNSIYNKLSDPNTKVDLTYDGNYTVKTGVTIVKANFTNSDDYTNFLTNSYAVGQYITDEVYDLLEDGDDTVGQGKVVEMSQDELDTYMANKSSLDTAVVTLTIKVTQLDER